MEMQKKLNVSSMRIVFFPAWKRGMMFSEGNSHSKRDYIMETIAFPG